MSLQGSIWMLTIKHSEFLPYLPPDVTYIKGQLELGVENNYLHWQVLVHFSRSVRLAAVKRIFGIECHAELSRSAAADNYVWKEETRVNGTQFELGRKPIKRASKQDWDKVWEICKSGRVNELDPGLRFYHYRTIKQIVGDFVRPIEVVRTVKVYWGDTELGKSRTAFAEAGEYPYIKNSRTKWWCGYQVGL